MARPYIENSAPLMHEVFMHLSIVAERCEKEGDFVSACAIRAGRDALMTAEAGKTPADYTFWRKAVKGWLFSFKREKERANESPSK